MDRAWYSFSSSGTTYDSQHTAGDINDINNTGSFGSKRTCGIDDDLPFYAGKWLYHTFVLFVSSCLKYQSPCEMIICGTQIILTIELNYR